MYYGLYNIDTYVSDFTAIAYQAEIIIRSTARPEMGWYACNIKVIQTFNRTIGFKEPTRHLITHHSTSWTHQLYKDKNMRVDVQRFHHPYPTKTLTTTIVIDITKVYSFYEDTNA